MPSSGTYRDAVDAVGERHYQFDDNASAQDYRALAMHFENRHEYERAQIKALLSISKAIEEQQ